jgi:hypothetical protein
MRLKQQGSEEKVIYLSCPCAERLREIKAVLEQAGFWVIYALHPLLITFSGILFIQSGISLTLRATTRHSLIAIRCLSDLPICRPHDLLKGLAHVPNYFWWLI